MRDVQVMMLAAGLGTRLWPLTADRAKPALPFLGRPLIRGMLDWLIGHGARRVVVNTHHQAASIRRALSGAPPEVSLGFSHEPEILGTAGCLARALQAGLLERHRTTLIVNAKLVTDIDLGAALAAHRAAGVRVTMVLRENARREAFTTVRVAGGRVTGFGPSRVPEGPRPLVFTGVHLIEPEVLARAELRFSDTVRNLYPPEIAAGRVLAHVDGEAIWAEASTLERYLDLQLAALDEGRGARAEDARVDPSAELESVWLGPGCEVGPGARLRRVVLGAGARVEAHAIVEDAVLWPSARIAPGVEARRIVLGEAASLEGPARLESAVAVPAEGLGAPPEGIGAARRRGELAVLAFGPERVDPPT